LAPYVAQDVGCRGLALLHSRRSQPREQIPIWFVITPRYSDRAHPIRWTVVRSSSESRSSFSISSHLDHPRRNRRASDHAQNLKWLRSTAATLPPKNAESSEKITEIA